MKKVDFLDLSDIFQNMKKIILIIVLVILLVVVWGFAKQSDKEISKEPVKFGAILILSGVGADYGDFSRKGMELAVQDINEAGGVLGRTLTIDYQDEIGPNPKGAVSAFNYLKSQGINFIIGTNWTPSGSAIAPLVDETTILISPSLGARSFAEAHENIFNMWPPDELNTKALANFVFDQGYKKVAVIGSQQEWDAEQATIFKDLFTSLGGKVVVFETPLTDNTDLRNEALRIKNSNAEAIVMTNHNNMAILTKRLSDISYKKPQFSVNLWVPNIDASEGTFEGLIFSTPFNPKKEFVDRYIETYSVQPNVPADAAYDTVRLLAEAINNAGTLDISEVQKELAAMKTWDGVSGVSTFDDKGSVTRPVSFFTIKNSKIEAVQN